jgi:EmrB/QacA subfamily drug resistance transporter
MPTPRTRGRIVPVVVACPLFLQNLDTSVMATALPSIARSLDVRVLDLNLAITAYLVSLAVCLPISGWLADRFGARRMFCIAILLFSLGSALCGMAASLPALVVYRLLQGVGGAMMLPVGRLILLRTVPQSEIVNAMVWFTIPGAVGRLAGPLFGGAVVTVASWHWIFLVNIPFGLLGVAMALWFIPPDVAFRQPRPLDVVGFVLLAAGLVGILGALEMADKGRLPWMVMLAMGASGVASLAAYAWHTGRCAAPLIDLRIFRFATYRAATLGGMPLRVAIGASPFLLPLMLQLGFGLSPLDSGLLTMATALGSLSTRTVIARAIRAVGFRQLLMASATLSSMFYVAYGFFTPRTPHATIFGVLLLGGLFNSMAMVSLNTLGYTEIPDDRMSHATTASMMMQQLSVCLGVVFGASLLAIVALWHHAAAGQLKAEHFAPAFAVIGAVTMLSVAWFSQLRPDEGDEVRRV